ncbi:MAG: MipA/OmpV family protein [Rhodoferax sp.]|jgi:outer membrane protein|nr:MipA/OmpV family protein [Rhodoferax sp.]
MKISHISGAAIFLASMAAHAQESGLPLWEAGVFGGAASTPAYPGADSRTSRALVIPYLIYRGEVFRSDRGGIGARVFRTTDLELDIGFAGSLPSNAKDTDARQGMTDLGTLIEFGPRVKWTLARPSPGTQLRLELPVRAVLEFNSGVNGQGVAFEPELVYEMRNIAGGWSLSTSGSLVWGDRKLNNYFYGVTPQFATASRPAFDAQSGLIATRVGLSTSKEITPDVRIFGFARYESYSGAANLASPLHQASSGSSVGIGLAWTLGRSAQRAAN